MNKENNPQAEESEQFEQEDYYEIIPTESAENTEEPYTEAPNTSGSLAPNVSGVLAYLFGVISGIIFLLVEKEKIFIRFHAWQFVILSSGFSIIVVLYGMADVLFIF